VHWQQPRHVSMGLLGLRASQSVGQVQDCYMKSEEDGNALVGHTVAQLKFTADEFDVLPHHFTAETLSEIGEFGWEKIVPDYNRYPLRYTCRNRRHS
jgi:hypothetical protein